MRPISTPTPQPDHDADWVDAEEELGATQGSLPHHPSETIFTWLMPRLPWFHAHSEGNASHVPAVSAVLHTPDQYGTEYPTLTMATRAGSASSSSNTSVDSITVDLVQVPASSTNPPHRASY